MICLRCDNEEFRVKHDAVIEQEFKGELLHVKSPAMTCTRCGWVTVALDQVDELRRHIADAYRKKHGLLTGDEIRAYRKVLHKNQREFAVFLGVGEASVKRWETWLVQEKSSNELIRIKSEREIFRRLAAQVTTTLWVFFAHFGKKVEASNGITVSPHRKPETLIPAQSVNADCAETAETQLETDYGFAANRALTVAA